MTPEEKATELVDVYRTILMNEDTECGNEILCTVIAKKSALIAVEEILDLGLHDVGDYRNDQESSSDFSTVTWYINYWEEVKDEIQNL